MCITNCDPPPPMLSSSAVITPYPSSIACLTLVCSPSRTPDPAPPPPWPHPSPGLPPCRTGRPQRREAPAAVWPASAACPLPPPSSSPYWPPCWETKPEAAARRGAAAGGVGSGPCSCCPRRPASWPASRGGAAKARLGSRWSTATSASRGTWARGWRARARGGRRRRRRSTGILRHRASLVLGLDVLFLWEEEEEETDRWKTKTQAWPAWCVRGFAWTGLVGELIYR